MSVHKYFSAITGISQQIEYVPINEIASIMAILEDYIMEILSLCPIFFRILYHIELLI
jgi:hypothetical protein